MTAIVENQPGFLLNPYIVTIRIIAIDGLRAEIPVPIGHIRIASDALLAVYVRMDRSRNVVCELLFEILLYIYAIITIVSLHDSYPPFQPYLLHFVSWCKNHIDK